MTTTATRLRRPRTSPTQPPSLKARPRTGFGGIESIPSRQEHRVGSRHRRWLVRGTLVGADLVGLSLAWIGHAVVVESFLARSPDPPPRLVAGVLLLGWLGVAHLGGLYALDDEHDDRSPFNGGIRVFVVSVVGAWGWVMAGAFGVLSADGPSSVVLWLCALVGVAVSREVARVLTARLGGARQRVAILGSGEEAEDIARKILRHPRLMMEVVGFIEAPSARGVSLPCAGFGDPRALSELVKRHAIDRVVVAAPRIPRAQLLECVGQLRVDGVDVDLIPSCRELVGPGSAFRVVEGLCLHGLRSCQREKSALRLKRAIDLCGAAVGLLLLSPLLFAIAVAVKLDSPGPTLFRQLRVGAAGSPFQILKFRTMAVGADRGKAALSALSKHSDIDPRMFKIDDDPRATRVGRVLRRLSLDEIPQLWNVLRGEMSLVGPRPLIPEEHVCVRSWGRRRLDVKPGMTGLWQACGRDNIPFGEMLKLDSAYATNWTVRGDFDLILRSLPALIGRRCR